MTQTQPASPRVMRVASALEADLRAFADELNRLADAVGACPPGLAPFDAAAQDVRDLSERLLTYSSDIEDAAVAARTGALTSVTR